MNHEEEARPLLAEEVAEQGAEDRSETDAYLE